MTRTQRAPVGSQDGMPAEVCEVDLEEPIKLAADISKEAYKVNSAHTLRSRVLPSLQCV